MAEKQKSVSDSVETLAAYHELDQVVVIGWRAADQRFVLVAHGKDQQEQAEAESFASRLMEGISAPKDRIDRYG